MATAKKLPSGSWRVRAYTHTDADGKQHYKSFTAPTKKEAERMALEYAPCKDRKDPTLAEAMTEYVNGRSSTLSPRTVSSYKSIMRNYVQGLQRKRISAITQADIQKAINIEATKLSPKTISNIHGFVTAVMYTYRPDFQIRTSLPKQKHPDLIIPSEEDIKKLMDAVSGTYMELPVLLAAFGPMRRGEICALRAEDISGNIVHVSRNLVKADRKDVTWLEKTPKSYAGDRFIEYPYFVRDVWESTGITTGRFVTVCPDTITKVFPQILKKNGIKHFRFHDLRHYSASIQHALGVPDAYIMQRGGWGNDRTLKQVYRHTLPQEAAEQSRKVNGYFSAIHDTKHDTKK